MVSVLTGKSGRNAALARQLRDESNFTNATLGGFWCERIVGISNVGQIQALRRADRATSSAILGLQGCGHILRRPRTCADTFQRADKAAHLVVKERTRPEIEAELLTIGNVHDFHARLIKRFHRAVCLTHGRSEGGEIMQSDQPVGPGLHRINVELMIDTPRQPRLMHQRRAARDQSEHVPPFSR